MVKVFVSRDSVVEDQATITGNDARHLALVLRKQVGDTVVVCVAGVSYTGVILKISSDQIEVHLAEVLKHAMESPLITHLYQGLIKGDKFDLVVQKATELGVNQIIPYRSEFSVIKLDQSKQESRIIRWQRIAKEAAKQSKRDQVPVISQVLTFDAVIRQLSGTPQSNVILMPYEQASENGFESLVQLRPAQVSILIGPEGGFHHREVQAVQDIGGKVVSLGPRILRTETAGFVALTLSQYLWGDVAGHAGEELGLR